MYFIMRKSGRAFLFFGRGKFFLFFMSRESFRWRRCGFISVPDRKRPVVQGFFFLWGEDARVVGVLDEFSGWALFVGGE